MERRNFISLSIAGVGASLVLPKLAVAGNNELDNFSAGDEGTI